MVSKAFIKNHDDIRSTKSQSVEELQGIQEESKKQELPDQKNIFGTASLRKLHKAANNLPDPTNPPLGFDKNDAFDSVYPFVRVPYLQPKTAEDVISFGDLKEDTYLDPKTKKIPLNAIFFGDNLHVLRALPSNSVDLIYIDPPFFSGREYNQLWGDDNEIRTFNDIWEDGLPSYLIWLNARLWEMRRILKNTGSIYVHCDWHANHYIKTEMDKIFGYESFKNHIVWQRTDPKSNSTKKYSVITDAILFYTKTDKYTFNINESQDALSESALKEYSLVLLDDGRIVNYKKGIEGRRFKLENTTVPSRNPERQFVWRGAKPSPNRSWMCSLDELESGLKDFRFYLRNPSKGSARCLVKFLDENKGIVPQDLWLKLGSMKGGSIYPTQKPETLLKRIIEISSKQGDIVADFFMGGGTTCVAAMSLKRKFIGCDISRVAASVTLDRLVGVGEEITNEESSLTIAKQQEQGSLLSSNKQLGLMQMEVIPNIHLFYVGIYPVEKFNSTDQKTFNEFILTCYGARVWTSSGAITGVMNASTTILVGSANPKEILSPETIRQFVQDSLRQRFDENIRMKIKIIAWSFPKYIQKYCQQLENFLEKQGVNAGIELIPINSEQFRHRITEQYAGRAVTDSDFLLKFIVSPTIGNIGVKRINALRYQFVAEGTHSNNLDGFLINCQWDFDYKNGRFSEKEYALMREKAKDEKRKGMYQAVLIATKKFEKPGLYTVACRVQDNLGAEVTFRKQIEIN